MDWRSHIQYVHRLLFIVPPHQASIHRSLSLNNEVIGNMRLFVSIKTLQHNFLCTRTSFATMNYCVVFTMLKSSSGDWDVNWQGGFCFITSLIYSSVIGIAFCNCLCILMQRFKCSCLCNEMQSPQLFVDNYCSTQWWV